MKCPECQFPSGHPQQPLQPLPEAGCGFVGKGNGHDTSGVYAPNSDKIGYAMSDYPSLTGAGAGNDKERPRGGLYGFSLCRVETGKYVHYQDYCSTRPKSGQKTYGAPTSTLWTKPIMSKSRSSCSHMLYTILTLFMRKALMARLPDTVSPPGYPGS